MIIRSSQMQTLQQAMDQTFVDEIADYISVNHSNTVAGMPDNLLKRRIHNGILRARIYGMTWRSSVTAFVVLMFVVAPNFDEHPLIHEILSNKKLQPDERINLIAGLTYEKDWEEAHSCYNDEAWNLKGE